MSQHCFTLDANYESKKKKLISMICECHEQAKLLGGVGQSYTDRAEQIKCKLENQPFRILTLGMFKNGKSTFTNALFGEILVPSHNVPCTLAISAVEYSPSKKGLCEIQFNDAPDGLPFISDKISGHVSRYKGKKIPPLTVSIEEANKVVRLNRTRRVPGIKRDKLKEQQDKAKVDSLFKKLTYFSDNQLLKGGIQVIDSPGFGESEIHNDITLSYIKQVDAFIFILDATHGGGAEEVEIASDCIVNKTVDRRASCFVVVNKIDAVMPEAGKIGRDAELSQRQQLKDTLENIEEIVSPFTSHPVYPISAQIALNARLSNDLETFNKSGFEKFENALSSFLANGELGMARLTGTCKCLMDIVVECLEETDKQKQILSQEYESLKASYESKKTELVQIQSNIEKVKKTLNKNAANVYDRINTKARVFFDNLFHVLVPQWLDNFEPRTKLSRNPLANKEDENKQLFIEIKKYIESKINAWSDDWQQGELLSSIEEMESKRIFSNDIVSTVDTLFASIQNIEDFIGGGHNDRARHSDVEMRAKFCNIDLKDDNICESVSSSEHLRNQAATTGTIVAAWMATHASAATAGTSITVATGAGLATISLAPVAIVAAAGIAIWAMVDVMYSDKRRKSQMKEEIKKSIVSNDKNVTDSVQAIVSGYSSMLQHRVDSVIYELNQRLSRLNSRTESALKTLRNGEQQNRLRELEAALNNFSLIRAELEEFVNRLKPRKA